MTHVVRSTVIRMKSSPNTLWTFAFFWPPFVSAVQSYLHTNFGKVIYCYTRVAAHVMNIQFEQSPRATRSHWQFSYVFSNTPENDHRPKCSLSKRSGRVWKHFLIFVLTRWVLSSRPFPIKRNSFMTFVFHARELAYNTYIHDFLNARLIQFWRTRMGSYYFYFINSSHVYVYVSLTYSVPFLVCTHAV